MNIVLYPNAKINIGLRVIARRSDGYHDIETLFYPLETYKDILEIVEEDSVSISFFGLPYRLPDDNPENDLCMKAYRLLCRDFDLPPVGIYLHKGIPAGSGLGGGSSDAAFTLKGLNMLFGLKLPDDALASYAAQLGSDCAFFIYNRPMFATGRGEKLSPFASGSIDALSDSSRYAIRVHTPEIRISTGEAYSEITPYAGGRGLDKMLSLPIGQWKEHITNDFETPVFKRHPEIAEIKNSLYGEGAVYASMSGSGSALYGIFEV